MNHITAAFRTEGPATVYVVTCSCGWETKCSNGNVDELNRVRLDHEAVARECDFCGATPVVAELDLGDRHGARPACGRCVSLGTDEPFPQRHAGTWTFQEEPQQCALCGDRDQPLTLRTVDLDPGNPEVGPRPDIQEVQTCVDQDACATRVKEDRQ